LTLIYQGSVSSVFGESEVLCFIEGGGRVEGEGSEFDAIDFCGLGVFGVGVEGRGCTPGEEPPIKFVLTYVKAKE
jgi:hypothetical protein